MVRSLTQTPTNGADLLTQYRVTGAPAVFEQIMRAYGGMVFSVCVKVTKDPADAEDASQAVFLTLAVQCKTGAVIRYLGPWLKKVAKRTSLDLVRSRKRRTRREQVTAANRPEHDDAHPSAKSEHGELSVILRAELDQLPSKYRLPLVLHYFGGLSHEEISIEMKCTPAALGVRLHRARKMLGKRLTDRGVSLAGTALSAALGASVGQCISDRFIRQTSTAMVAMGSGVAAPMMRMGLPAGLGCVPQLMAEVAASMARARIKWATAALVASVTMLGGAAEAVRHLPDSIRPNLEFLAPSRALDNLFRSFTPAPRLHLESPADRRIASAHVPVAPPADPVPQYASALPVLLPPVPAGPTERRYFLQIPTYPPPVSTYLPKLPPAAVQPPLRPAAPPALPVTREAPPVILVRNTPAPVSVPAGGSSSSGETASAGEMQIVPPTTTPRRRDPTASPVLPQFDAPPVPRKNLPQNPQKPSGIGSFEFAAVGGQDVLGGSTLAAGPFADVRSIDGDTAGYIAHLSGASLNLADNDVYVSGDGVYHWRDPANGIGRGGVNSVQLTLNGSQSDGIVSISRLSPGSTLAPARPNGHTFIGLWTFDTGAAVDSVSLKVRYDDLLAQSLGLRESDLKLWVYDTDRWVRINDSTFSRDLANHTVSGTWDGFSYIGVSAPDPASVTGLLGLAAGWMLRRRRAK